MFRSFAPEENRMGGESMEVIKVNKMEVRMDEKQTVGDVAEELLEVLQRSGRDFMTLSAMQKAMSSQLRKRLGLTGRKLTNPSVIKILTPHLEDKLAICNKGNAVYLFRGTNLAEVVLCFIRGKAGKSGPQLFNGMPFIKKDELIRILNNLLESGQVTLKLAAEFAPRFFASGAMGPVMKDAAGTACETPIDTFGKRREQFHAAFRELDRGSIFVRICDLRRRMGWPREVFDDMLRRLRDNEVVQLHAGDVTLMTPEQVEDGFVDENGFRMGTMTWIG